MFDTEPQFLIEWLNALLFRSFCQMFNMFKMEKKKLTLKHYQCAQNMVMDKRDLSMMACKNHFKCFYSRNDLKKKRKKIKNHNLK